MTSCLFATDLHGKNERYEKLFRLIREELPQLVLLGGDLLPHGLHRSVAGNYTEDYLAAALQEIRAEMGRDYPEILVILGNDDPRSEEEVFIRMEQEGIWHYIHNRRYPYNGYTIYGYALVPPTPFRYKDWERYDVSRYVDPGCISPEEGIRTVDVDVDISMLTIRQDLEILAGEDNMERAIFLFHSPPYKTLLDRAALDGKMIDYVPLDVNVGSVAIKEFIEHKQPWITMHGHIHESTRITGHWMQQLDRTTSFNGAWDGPELSVIDFEMDKPWDARRRLL